MEKVREGSAGDIDLMDSVDRRDPRRRARPRPRADAAASWRLVVSDTSTGSGYAYVDARGALALLAATNRRTAARLLWEALAAADRATPTVAHVTAANEWAIDVGLAARLELHQEGYLALRGMKPPAPYLHNGALL